MSKHKHVAIEKVDGEPYLDNHFNLYADGRVVAKDVPFETLAAAPEMLEALKLALEVVKTASEIVGDGRGARLVGLMRATIAKAEGLSE